MAWSASCNVSCDAAKNAPARVTLWVAREASKLKMALLSFLDGAKAERQKHRAGTG